MHFFFVSASANTQANSGQNQAKCLLTIYDTEEQQELPNPNSITSEEDIQIVDEENLPFSPEINT